MCVYMKPLSSRQTILLSQVWCGGFIFEFLCVFLGDVVMHTLAMWLCYQTSLCCTSVQCVNMWEGLTSRIVNANHYKLPEIFSSWEVSLEPRFSVPDFVLQLWRKRQNSGRKAWVQIFLQNCETKSGTESLDLRLGLANNCQCVTFQNFSLNRQVDKTYYLTNGYYYLIFH